MTGATRRPRVEWTRLEYENNETKARLLGHGTGVEGIEGERGKNR